MINWFPNDAPAPIKETLYLSFHFLKIFFCSGAYFCINLF
jgi:hypothetical protein